MKYESFKRDAIAAIAKSKEKSLSSVGAYVRGQAVMLAPVNTGRLKGSISYEVKDDHVDVGTNLEYGIYVEKGTGIYADDGKGRKTPWVYKDETTGESVFTVGSRPQPYLTPAAERNIKTIAAIVGKAMKL